MNWFEKAAAVTKIAASFAAEKTMEGAKFVADKSKETYEELTSYPSCVNCEGCGTQNKVDPAIFRWPCASEKCKQAGISHPVSVQACPQCNGAAQSVPCPTIICLGCQAAIEVPTSNAAKGFKTAVADTKRGATIAVALTKKAAVETVSYTKSTLNDLKSAPKQMPCKKCNIQLDVPAELFERTCKSDQCTEAKTCESCLAAKNDPVLLSCPSCETTNKVPTSLMMLKLKGAQRTTKRAWKATSSSVSKEWKHQTARPDKFPCRYCNEMLYPDGEPSEEPGSVGLAEDCAAEGDFGKYQETDQERSRIMCHKCNNENAVPGSNFMKYMEGGASDLSKGSSALYYDLSKKPYLLCPRCSTKIGVPGVAQGGQEAVSIQCGSCKLQLDMTSG